MLMSSVPQSVKPGETFGPQDYIDYGWHIIPVSSNKIPLVKGWVTRQPAMNEFPRGCRISQVTGPQLDGTWIIGPEFDHKPEDGIDATENFELLLSKISESLFNKLHITLSTRGEGYHIRAQVPRPVAASIIRDATGKKVGDLRSAGGHLVIQQPDKWLHGAPWTMQTLTDAETDELLAALYYQAPVTPATSTLDWGAVKSIDVAQLLINGIPGRFRPTSQSAHALRNTVPPQRSSDIRFYLIGELIACDYSDTQTAALALHLTDFGVRERKGQSWLEQDIERCIAKINAGGMSKRKKMAQEKLDILAGGVPHDKHEAPYLFWFSTQEAGGKVIMSRAQRATSYGVSVSTLDRIETRLISRGQIRRGLSANRQVAWVERVSEPADLGTVISDTPHIYIDLSIEDVCTQNDSTSETAAPGAPLLVHVVEDAVEIVSQNGTRKHQADIILGLVRAVLPDTDPELVAWHAARAIKWRKERLANEALKAKLAALTTKQLKSKQRGLERKAADLHQKGKPRQAWVFGRLAWFVQKELDTPERQAKQKRAKAIQQVLGGVD